jgi:hypothetical protein
MIPIRARNALVAGVAGIALVGCFGYYQPTTTDLEGRRVQVSLTDAGSVALAPRLGRNVADVEGTVAADSANAYILSVLGTKRRDGQESDWSGERVAIPRDIVSTVRERRFSRSRTTLFTVLTAAFLIASKQAFGSGGGSNAPGTTPGGPPGGK